jgi:hypothetical protein
MAVVIASSLALPALFATASPAAAANCTTSNCATVNVVFATGMGNPGYGLITGSDGGLSCSDVSGHGTGTCSDKVSWALASSSDAFTLTAAPHTGSQACYSHDGANLACSPVGQNYVLHLTLLPNTSTSSIFFFILTQDTLVVSMTGSGTGVVKANGTVVSCPGSACGRNYNYGDVLQFTAIASKGTFQKWGGDCAGQGPTCVLAMTATHRVSAEFDLAATPAPTSPTGPHPTRTPGPVAGSTAAPDASGSLGLTVLAATAEDSASDLAAIATSAGTSPEPLAAAAGSQDSGGTPWIPIILVVVLLVAGANLAIFQVVRARRS